MKNKLSKIFIAAGSLMIIAAFILCVKNIYDNRKAAKYSADALSELKLQIPSAPPDNTLPSANNDDDLFYQYEKSDPEDNEPEEISVGGYGYCGYITLPALDIELPVMNDFDMSYLKRAPCRYSGSARTNDLIIAAHNYSSHFGRIGSLSSGDIIVFTDTSGRKYNYTVSFTEQIDGDDGERMHSGAGIEWSLTLFSCDLSGRNRVTVRAEKQDS
jgi:sortase A